MSSLLARPFYEDEIDERLENEEPRKNHDKKRSASRIWIGNHSIPYDEQG